MLVLFQYLFKSILFISIFHISRRSLYDEAVFSKRLYLVAKDAQVRNKLLQQNRIGRRQLNRRREKASLNSNRFSLHRFFKALIQNSFMRILLMNQDKTAFIFRCNKAMLNLQQ